MAPHHRFGLALVLAVAGAQPVGAQATDAGKWEIAFHGGGHWSTDPAGGTVSLPGPGPVFTTATNNPTPPPSSRRQSSWYFGDGATLFNQAAVALFAQRPGAVPTSITALDPVLGRSLGKQTGGGSFGVTISRVLTPRLGAELSVDYSLARHRITSSNVDAIEATRASFIPAFTDVVRFNPNRVLNEVTSTAALERGNARQLITSGAVIVNLRTTGRVRPFVRAGAGLIVLTGKTPTATLRGNYQFRLPNGAPISEIDTLTVKDDRDERALAGILGGGVKYQVSSRWGIRLDARVFLSRNTATTVIDAAPNVTLGQLPAGRGVLGGEPSIQFSNSSDPVTALGVTTVSASTLTGPAITGLRTFSGSGVASVTNVTVGIFWRF